MGREGVRIEGGRFGTVGVRMAFSLCGDCELNSADGTAKLVVFISS